jgi:uncharacterized protein YkwD
MNGGYLLNTLAIIVSVALLVSATGIACAIPAGSPPGIQIATPVSGPAPLDVTFNIPSGNAVPLWTFWDFGDGMASMAGNPVHVYQQPGTYPVTLISGFGSGTSPVVLETAVHVFQPLLPIPSSGHVSLDPDRNGLYEDINGDGSVNFRDVIDFFVDQEWIAAHEPPESFDFDGDGAVLFGDIIQLFRVLPDGGIITPAPTAVPTIVPTSVPTTRPTTVPTTIPTTSPTTVPTTIPATIPTTRPTTIPTTIPTTSPTTVPTTIPTTIPTTRPTMVPTTIPTTSPTTVPTTLPSVTPSPTPDSAGLLEQAILKYTNIERAKRNLAALSWNSHIAAASKGHSELMVRTGTGGHVLPGEPGVGDRLSNNGVSWYSYGENIAFGFRGSDPDQAAAAIVHAWVWDDAGSSWGHRHNILDGITSDPGYNDNPCDPVNNPMGYRNFGFNQMGAGAVYGTVALNGNSYTGWQVTQDLAKV